MFVSLVALGVTALVELVIALISGSVALLADTIHNFADALTAVPLALAFRIGRRPPTRRYTYGFGRAEDLAGICIVVVHRGLHGGRRATSPSTGWCIPARSRAWAG